jgi:hypothetical protein
MTVAALMAVFRLKLSDDDRTCVLLWTQRVFVMVQMAPKQPASGPVYVTDEKVTRNGLNAGVRSDEFFSGSDLAAS